MRLTYPLPSLLTLVLSPFTLQSCAQVSPPPSLDIDSVQAYERLAAQYEDHIHSLGTEDESDEILIGNTQLREHTLPAVISSFIPRFRLLAAAHPHTQGAGRALSWIALHAWESKDLKDAVDPLIAEYVDQSYMTTVCWALSLKPTAYASDALDRIVKQATSPRTELWALYCQSRHNLMIADLLMYLREPTPAPNPPGDWRASFPRETLAWLDTLNATTLENDAVKSLERVIASADDVQVDNRCVADVARAALFEVQHLRIGQVAPEIQGEDVNGVRFTLSQYRGKIVVLDFWGHW